MLGGGDGGGRDRTGEGETELEREYECHRGFYFVSKYGGCRVSGWQPVLCMHLGARGMIYRPNINP